MEKRKVLLLVDDGELRARYELILRFSGFEPVSVDSASDVPDLQNVVAGCVLTHHHSAVDAVTSRLLAAAVPVVRIDPFIRHAREHLPFDVVLPATSEPRELITALRHLSPHALS
jgi:hypothetical protein